MTNESRNALVKTAIRTIYTSSYESVGVSAITEQSGIPKGSFYHWFRSKEELASAAIDGFAEAGNKLRRQLLADDGTPPLERLRKCFEYSAALLEKREFRNGCMLGNLSLEMADRSELLRAHLLAAFERWEAALREVLGEARARAELPADLIPEDAAAFILNAWEGALLRMKVVRTAQPLQLFQHMVFEHLLASPKT
jgi:TetR/AcrR family transcriptional regulator, transcriptional repressor for nem operon